MGQPEGIIATSVAATTTILLVLLRLSPAVEVLLASRVSPKAVLGCRLSGNSNRSSYVGVWQFTAGTSGRSRQTRLHGL